MEVSPFKCISYDQASITFGVCSEVNEFTVEIKIRDNNSVEDPLGEKEDTQTFSFSVAEKN